MAKKADAAEVIQIDFPKQREVVALGGYAVRISAAASGRVEVSVNGGAWSACRAGAGFWWYDWSGYGAGTHKISARLIDDAGVETKSPLRSFKAGA